MFILMIIVIVVVILIIFIILIIVIVLFLCIGIDKLILIKLLGFLNIFNCRQLLHVQQLVKKMLWKLSWDNGSQQPTCDPPSSIVVNDERLLGDVLSLCLHSEFEESTPSTCREGIAYGGPWVGRICC